MNNKMNNKIFLEEKTNPSERLSLLPVCVVSRNREFQRFLNHLGRFKPCSDFAPPYILGHHCAVSTPEPRCAVINPTTTSFLRYLRLLTIVIFALLLRSKYRYFLLLLDFGHPYTPCLWKHDTTPNSTKTKFIIANTLSPNLSSAAIFYQQLDNQTVKISTSKSSKQNLHLFSRRYIWPSLTVPSSYQIHLFFGINVILTLFSSYLRWFRWPPDPGIRYTYSIFLAQIISFFEPSPAPATASDQKSCSHFPVAHNISFPQSLLITILNSTTYCVRPLVFSSTFLSVDMSSKQQKNRYATGNKATKTNSSSGPKKAASASSNFTMTPDPFQDQFFATGLTMAPPATIGLQSTAQPEIFPELFRSSLADVLRRRTQARDMYQAPARAILISGHTVLPQGQTIDLLRKHVAQLARLGYNVEAAQFQPGPDGRALTNTLQGLTDENTQVKGDLFSTSSHLAIVLNLAAPQSIAEPMTGTGILSPLFTMHFHAGTKETDGRYVKVRTSLDVVPISSRRCPAMSMQAYSSDDLHAPRYIYFLNLVVILPELEDFLYVYISLLTDLFQQVLTEDEYVDLATRLIIGPTAHTYTSDSKDAAATKNRFARFRTKGLCILMKVDPHNEDHQRIREKLLCELLSSEHDYSRVGELCGLPALLSRPMPGRPPKDVPAKLIPNRMLKNCMYKLIMHNMPMEYNSHHLYVFLTYVLGAEGIKHTMQIRPVINDAEALMRTRLAPSFVVLLEDGKCLQALFASADVCRAAIVEEQLSYTVLQENSVYDIPDDAQP